MFSTTFNKEEKIWRGNDIPPLYDPNQISLAQALLSSMTNHGPKIAQISDNNGVKMTFDEIKSKTIRAAQNLQSLGYKRGQVFSLVARNSHHVAPITFASMCIGCPVSSLDESFGKTELNHMFKITQPVLVFCDIDCYEKVDACLAALGNRAKIYTFGGSVGRSEDIESLFRETNIEDQFIPVKVDGPNDIAMIVCSSGTTGLPKGLCLSHATLLDHHSKRSDMSSSSDVMFCFASLHWVAGLGVLIRGTLIGATRLITTESFDADLSLRLIEQYKVTYSLHGPHHILFMIRNENLSKTNLSSLKYLIVGGCKAPPYLKMVNSHLPNGNLYVAYGMRELGGLIAFDYPITNEKGVTGRLVDGVSVKIIDDDQKRCGPNVNGEIFIKNRYKFLGYYNNQQATDEAVDEEGFIATGDLGYFDEDGNLCITGRKKEILKYWNYQVSPALVDSYLSELPGIKEACVVGIPDMMADLPAAVIVRAEGSKISEKYVNDMVADHFVDHYKLRGGLYFVDSLPLTPSGKVNRRQATETAITMYKARNI